MLTFKTVWSVLRSPITGYVVLGIAAISGLSYGYLAIDHRGYARAERACELAETQDSNQLLLDAIHAQEAARQQHLAEIERGERISEELSKTQRRLDATKTEYLAYANGIVGNCPADLGRLLMPSTAHSDSEGAGKDTTSGPPAHTADTVDAAPIAANIALNRWACETNFAAHSALLRWHEEGHVK